ncbi:MAG TPA: hypothetical protein VJQ82_24725 [Terriglobales bacterium]|nr:hypothetical protein [Terriglobales bacterium]
MKRRKPPMGLVLVPALRKPSASPKLSLAEEERAFTAHYLRLADTALTDPTGKSQAMTGVEDAMHRTKVKVSKYAPLTFACIVCDRQFVVGDKDLGQLGKELAEHCLRDHPEQHPRAQRKAA